MLDHNHQQQEQFITTGTYLKSKAQVGASIGQQQVQRHFHKQLSGKQQLQTPANCPSLATFKVMEILEHQKQRLSSNDSLNTNQTNQQTLYSTNEATCGDIYHDQDLDDRLAVPQTYPNNTLIVDLNKCHRNITSFWTDPQSAGARTATAALNNFRNCWPLLSGRRRFDNSNNDEEVESVTSSRTNDEINTTARALSPAQQDCKQNTHIEINDDGAKIKGKRRRYKFYMPESLLKTNIKLRLDDYDNALNVLTNDVRYQLHLLLYRRVQTIWLLMSSLLCILVPFLSFATLETFILASACLSWVGLQCIGYFITFLIRKKLDEMLEKSVAQVNTFFMDHNLMLGVINFGSLLSKTKLTIPMLYFDTSQCREQIESIINIDSKRSNVAHADDTHIDNILDYSKFDLSLVQPNVKALAQSQLAKKIVLRYSQRWISYFEKRKLMFTDERVRPRHLSTGKCLCQFIEEHFKNVQQFKKQRQQQPNLTTIIANNSYANTQATLVLGEKQTQQPTEILVDKQTVLPQFTSPTIPTLSHLVALKESLKIDTNYGLNTPTVTGDTNFNNNNNNIQPNSGLYFNSWHQKLGDNIKLTLETPPHLLVPKQETSASLSLEMGSDLISRSDDLVKKLRLLLVLRKNELQGLDHESLFSGVLHKTPQQSNSIESDSISINNNNEGKANSVNTSPKLKQNSAKLSFTKTDSSTDSGKKFYNQKEGLFFFGHNGAKKVQHQQDIETRNHVLEIC